MKPTSIKYEALLKDLKNEINDNLNILGGYINYINKTPFKQKLKILGNAFLTVILVTVSMLINSCSAFQSTQRLDLSPYAENIIQITGDIQYGLSQSQIIYLRDYINGPNVELLHDYGAKTRKMIRNIISYSVEVVTLGNSEMDGHQKAKKLADYLERLLRPVLEKPESKLDFTNAELDTVLNDVRNQEKFLDALGATQPLIDNIAATLGRFLDVGKEVLDDAIEEIHNEMMNDNRIVIVGNRNLRDNQIYTMYNLLYLQQYRSGDKSAIDSLFAKEPSLKEFVVDQNNITSADLRAIEQRMDSKLKFLHEVREQLSVDLELYNKQMYELDVQSKIYKEALRQVRVVVVVWSEAHRKLAAGVTDPAQIDLVGMVVRSANKILP
jgi:hypothetical protein